MTLYPDGYGTELISLDEMRRRHGAKMHPEFASRFFAWIVDRAGQMGVGGGWRPTPSDTSQASREGKSFHQDQRFASGIVAYAAVDLVHRNGSNVHRAPTWAEVPAQGSDWATTCGVHCNVSGEPWHIQPCELDGWQTWCNDGRPDPTPTHPPDHGDDDMTNEQLAEITGRLDDMRNLIGTINDRVDKIVENTGLTATRTSAVIQNTGLTATRTAAIVGDADRVADEVVGPD